MGAKLYSTCWDFARLGLGAVSGANAAVFSEATVPSGGAGSCVGNLGFVIGLYAHGNIGMNPVPGTTTLNGQILRQWITASEALVTNLDITFSEANQTYTLASTGGVGNFKVTWNGALGAEIRDILGFSATLDNAASYTSTRRPKYIIVSNIANQSDVKESYEPTGRIGYAESDSGLSYGIAPDKLPLYRDWTQPFEARIGPTNAAWSGTPGIGGAPLRRKDRQGLSESVWWTWEDFYRHVRAQIPFRLYSPGDGGGVMYKLIGDSAHFDPARVTADYDNQWNIPFKTIEIGGTYTAGLTSEGGWVNV